MSRLFAAAIAVVLLPAIGFGQLIVANNSANQIFHVNVETGVAVPLNAPSGIQVTGLTLNPDSNQIYWTSTTQGFRGNLVMGSSPFIGPAGNFGPNGHISGLAYAPEGNTLFGMIENPNAFRSVSANGGVMNPLAYNFAPLTGIDGLEYSWVHERLFALNDQPTGFTGLHFFYPGPRMLRYPYPGSHQDIDGLAIFGDRAYLVPDGELVPNTSNNILVVSLNTGTLVGTLPNPLGAVPANWCGATFAPMLVNKRIIRGTLALNDTTSQFVLEPNLSAARTLTYRLLQGTTVIQSGPILAYRSAQRYEFMVPATLNGAFTLEFSGGAFLTRRIPITLPTGGFASVPGNASIMNGDANDSGEVDAVDIDLTIATFGSSWPMNSTSPLTDFNLDDEVDAVDIDIAIANFGAVDD